MPGKEYLVKRLVSKLFAGGTANRVLATADGATSAWQQVATAMLAANAVSQVAQQASSPASAFTLAAAANCGTALSFTSTGGDIIVVATVTIAHNAGGAPRFGWSFNRNGLGDVNEVRGSCAGAAGENTLVSIGYYAAPAAGAQSIQGRGRNVDASGTFTAYLVNLLAIELKR